MFLTSLHEERFNEFVERDNTGIKDRERKALFLVFASNEDLYSKVNDFYDFDDHSIKLEGFDQVDLTSAVRGLVELAFNLYNNYSHPNESMKSVNDLFADLDDRNFELALTAIRVRFDQVIT